MTQKILLLLAFSLLVVPCFAVEKSHSQGRLIDVEQKSRDKVDMYLVNTPVTTAVPYFELTVEIANTDYVAEYTPRHADEQLPPDWRPGADVDVRIEKHDLFLKRSDGSEVEWIITKRIPLKQKTEKKNQRWSNPCRR